MHLEPVDPPRTFRVGLGSDVTLAHVADLELDENELVTFRTPSGANFDVTRKLFGFYATGSLNDRVPRSGLRPALVRNAESQYFVMLVEPALEEVFAAYCLREDQTVLAWLDDQDTLAAIARAARSGS